MEGKLYGFDLKRNGIMLAERAYEFMLKYKTELEKLNYYAWAKFMEKINEDDVLVKVLDKLELSTPNVFIKSFSSDAASNMDSIFETSVLPSERICFK